MTSPGTPIAERNTEPGYDAPPWDSLEPEEQQRFLDIATSLAELGAGEFDALAGALLEYETLSGDEIKRLIAGEDIGRADQGPKTPSVPSAGTSIPKTKRPSGPFGSPSPAGA